MSDCQSRHPWYTVFFNLREDNRLYTTTLEKQFCTSCHNLPVLGSQRSKDWTYCFQEHGTQGSTSHRFWPSVCPYGGRVSACLVRPEGQTLAWQWLQRRGVERSRGREPAWRMALDVKSETLWAGERHSERQKASITASPSDTVMRTALHKPTHTYPLALALSSLLSVLLLTTKPWRFQDSVMDLKILLLKMTPHE